MFRNRSSSRSAKLLCQAKRDLFSARASEVHRELWEACSQGDRAAARHKFEALLLVIEAREATGEIAAALQGNISRPLFLTSGLFLERSFRSLAATPAEDMHFVTGARIGDIYSLDRVIRVNLDRSTAERVTANHESSHRALIELDERDLLLHGVVHIHPGKGPDATKPSSADLKYHSSLEKVGYTTIGLIYSRDGYTRAYSHKMDFEIQVTGKDVERLGRYLFRIKTIGNGRYFPSHANGARRSRA